jgi:nicotinate-nucleotide adenylyltransferase
MTQLAISATRLRELLAAGKSVRYLLPDSVLDYINLYQLYKSP